MKGLCRACLGVADPPKSLFSEDGRRETPAYLVWKCTGVRLAEGDRLPESLCQKCFVQLSIANHFRLLVQKSNSLLLQCFDLTVQLEPCLKIQHDTDVTVENTKSEFIINFENENNTVTVEDIKSEYCTDLKNENNTVTVEDIKSEYCMDFKNENITVAVEDIESGYCVNSENNNTDIESELTGNISDIDISEVKIEVDENNLNDNFINNESTIDGTNEECVVEFASVQTDHKIRDNPLDNEDESENSKNKKQAVAELGQNKPSNIKRDESDKCFARKEKLQMHKIARIHKEYTCLECDTKFRHKQSYYKHYKSKHTNERNFACTLCDKKFIYKFILNKHMLTHTDPFRCKSCNVSFKTKIDLTDHRSIQHSNCKKYACHLCEFATHEKRILRHHIKTHNAQMKYACHLCTFVTTLHVYLKTHLRTHAVIKKYACDACEYTTHSKQKFEVHISRHTTEKKFACNLCKYVGKIQKDLNAHLAIHDKTKKYACDLCRYSTHSKQCLYRHTRMHNTEKKFACHLCKFVTNVQTTLKKHLRKHTIIKKYTCDMCGFTTNSKPSLCRHMKTHST